MSEHAESLLLADVDSFTSWLADHCHKSPRIHLGYVDTLSHKVLERCDTASIPELVALALYPSKETRNWAMDRLAALFIAGHQDWLRQVEEDMQG